MESKNIIQDVESDYTIRCEKKVCKYRIRYGKPAELRVGSKHRCSVDSKKDTEWKVNRIWCGIQAGFGIVSLNPST